MPANSTVLLYQVCVECEWIYTKATDLEAAYAETVKNMKPPQQPLPAGMIRFCQECLHDFMIKENTFEISQKELKHRLRRQRDQEKEVW